MEYTGKVEMLDRDSFDERLASGCAIAMLCVSAGVLETTKAKTASASGD